MLLVTLIAIALALCLLLGMATTPNIRDALLKKTTALPNGAATVYSVGIDTETTPNGVHVGNVEWLLSAPAMNATEMPDAKTMKYSVVYDTVLPIDGSSIALMTDVITQTGAGGVGCAAATYRFRLPSTAGRILGIKAVGSASGNATTASFTLEALA